MKRVELGSVEHGGEDIKVQTFLYQLLDTVPDYNRNGEAVGISPSSMMARKDIMEKLKELPDDAEYVDLENSEHAVVSKHFENATFVRVSDGVLAVGKKLRDAKAPPKSGDGN